MTKNKQQLEKLYLAFDLALWFAFGGICVFVLVLIL